MAEVAAWALVALVAGVYSATLAGARPAVAMVIVGACALAAVMLAAYAALRATQRVVRAEGFELVDRRGQVRATLTVEESGAGLALFDGERNLRAVLNTVADGTPGLVLYDPLGKARANIVALPDAGFLALFDREGRLLFSAPQIAGTGEP